MYKLKILIVSGVIFLIVFLLLTKIGFRSDQEASKYIKTSGFDYFIQLSQNYIGKNYGKTNKELCEEYAKLAIRHAQRRKNESCVNYIRLYQNDPANQWSHDYKSQYNWCTTVSVFATEMETIYRERRLKDCMIGL